MYTNKLLINKVRRQISNQIKLSRNKNTKTTDKQLDYNNYINLNSRKTYYYVKILPTDWCKICYLIINFRFNGSNCLIHFKIIYKLSIIELNFLF